MIALLHFLPEIFSSFDNHIWGTAGQLFSQEKCKLLRSPIDCYRREFVGPRQTLLPVLLGHSFMTRQRHWHKLPVYTTFAKFPHKLANLLTACSRNMQLQPKQDISNTIYYRLHSTTVQVRYSY